MLRIKAGKAGWEARMLPLCYADHLQNWLLVKQKSFVVSGRLSLVWTNSAQMMQPYFPIAFALPGSCHWFWVS